ncbi:lactate utilization protein C [Arcticibacter sp. MXS-1]|uniref:LutC/YkgG family protein n=1 Tax=Arcticibacter sp. MXS-1 TaxID=3341726 RepID=UPI0035A8B7A1
MSQRENILAAVKANQPSLVPLPDVSAPRNFQGDLCEKFKNIAITIGSRVLEVRDFDEIKEQIRSLFPTLGRTVSSYAELSDVAQIGLDDADPHSLRDVDLAILKAEFGVAENGSMWLPETNMMQRALPFITQHLALVLNKAAIVATMHEAYLHEQSSNPGFGAFIAGPSKTADIEQSLVLGAHGPRSMTVFLL